MCLKCSSRGMRAPASVRLLRQPLKAAFLVADLPKGYTRIAAAYSALMAEFATLFTIKRVKILNN